MSYNISSFRLKSVSLELPRRFNILKWAEQNGFGDRVFEDIIIHTDDTWGWNDDGEGFGMTGKVTNGSLKVTDIQWRGEGSGNDSDLVAAIFAQFKGSMEANRIWEGGDSIDHISIKRGVVSEEDIDL